MNERYRVLVVGAGKPGMHHAAAFQANARFELAAVCDIDEARLDAATEKLRVTLNGAWICPLLLASSDTCEAVTSRWSVDFANSPDEEKMAAAFES